MTLRRDQLSLDEVEPIVIKAAGDLFGSIVTRSNRQVVVSAVGIDRAHETDRDTIGQKGPGS
jgi:hypothetical protein